MKARQTLVIILAAVTLAASWEFLGHLFLMGVEMSARHWVDAVVATTFTVTVAAIAARMILVQHRKLTELARLRDYLLKMESHYLRLPAGALEDPSSYFETQAARERFSDAQSHLASNNATVRANALLEIATLASVASGGRKKELTLFGRAASHLSAALYLEEDPVVRAQALAGIRQLSQTAIEAAGGHSEWLAGELAHGNRVAWEYFRESVVSVAHATGGHSGVDRDIRKALDILGCSDESVAAVLEVLVTSDAAAIRSQDRNTGHERKALVERARLLKDTREGLACVLKNLRTPDDIPGSSEALRTWKRAHHVTLSGCFLGFADLRDTQLAGVDLNDSCLVGAQLTGADLRWADLKKACLKFAHLYGADLTFAKLTFADLRNSGLSTAIMVGADLTWAQLSQAHMLGTKLDAARLFRAQMAAEDGETGFADLNGANWWDACFDDPLSNEEDRKLQAWLKSRFPAPADSGIRHSSAVLSR